jgi:hypothetical protein
MRRDPQKLLAENRRIAPQKTVASRSPISNKLLSSALQERKQGLAVPLMLVRTLGLRYVWCGNCEARERH